MQTGVRIPVAVSQGPMRPLFCPSQRTSGRRRPLAAFGCRYVHSGLRPSQSFADSQSLNRRESQRAAWSRVAGYFRARERAVYKVLGIYERLGDGAAATVEGATPSP